MRIRLYRRVNRGNNGSSYLNNDNSWNANDNNGFRPRPEQKLLIIKIKVLIT